MNTLHARRLGVDTYQEHVVYMHHDCVVCRAEGFEAQSRIELSLRGRRIIATLNVVMSDLLRTGEVGLSEAAWRALQASEGDAIVLRHAPTLDSFSHVRAKVYGHTLDGVVFNAIIADVAAFGFLNPMIAGASMALSSLSVIINSALLKRVKLDQG